MNNCALIIGHKKSSQGAQNLDSKLTEFYFNEKLSIDIEKNFKSKSCDIQRIYRRTYKSLPSDINEYSPDFSISLHCNAFNKKVSGTEVLFYHKCSLSKEISEIILNNLVNVLDLKNRGIKPIDSEDRGGYLVSQTYRPCVIVEPFFIDNNNDLSIVEKNYVKLVNAYVKSIQEISCILDM